MTESDNGEILIKATFTFDNNNDKKCNNFTNIQWIFGNSGSFDEHIKITGWNNVGTDNIKQLFGEGCGLKSGIDNQSNISNTEIAETERKRNEAAEKAAAEELERKRKEEAEKEAVEKAAAEELERQRKEEAEKAAADKAAERLRNEAAELERQRKEETIIEENPPATEPSRNLRSKPQSYSENIKIIELKKKIKDLETNVQSFKDNKDNKEIIKTKNIRESLTKFEEEIAKLEKGIVSIDKIKDYFQFENEYNRLNAEYNKLKNSINKIINKNFIVKRAPDTLTKTEYPETNISSASNRPILNNNSRTRRVNSKRRGGKKNITFKKRR